MSFKIFNAKCNDCGHVGESFFRNSTGIGKCEQCGSINTEKLPTISSIQTESSPCRYGNYTEKMTPLQTPGNGIQIKDR